MPIMKLESEAGAFVAWMDDATGCDAARAYGVVLARNEGGRWLAHVQGTEPVDATQAARYDAMTADVTYVDDGSRRWLPADSQRLRDERAAILTNKK